MRRACRMSGACCSAATTPRPRSRDWPWESAARYRRCSPRCSTPCSWLPDQAEKQRLLEEVIDYTNQAGPLVKADIVAQFGSVRQGAPGRGAIGTGSAQAAIPAKSPRNWTPSWPGNPTSRSPGALRRLRGGSDPQGRQAGRQDDLRGQRRQDGTVLRPLLPPGQRPADRPLRVRQRADLRIRRRRAGEGHRPTEAGRGDQADQRHGSPSKWPMRRSSSPASSRTPRSAETPRVHEKGLPSATFLFPPRIRAGADASGIRGTAFPADD